MLYRKSSPNPPRFLLRIVATAGASALLSVAACGGDTGGSTGNPNPDAETTGPCGAGPCGVVPLPTGDSGWVGGGSLPAPTDAGPEARTGPCGGGPCGVVVMPHDAGEASIVGGGTMVSLDSGGDAHGGPCNGGPCGVIIHPEAGFD
jgi:hypothetical protein